MLKRLQTAICLSVAVSALSTSSVYANDWFDQQRSMSDGSDYSTHDYIAGSQGRSAPVSVSAKDHQSLSWLDLQRSISDGYSQAGAEAESPFQGASLVLDPNESFVERGRRITDGTTE